jgi:hypothetical protein
LQIIQENKAPPQKDINTIKLTPPPKKIDLVNMKSINTNVIEAIRNIKPTFSIIFF